MAAVSQTAATSQRVGSHWPITNTKALREAFRLFDKDNDGNITADELYDVMSSIGQMVSRQQAVDMIQLVDTDGNGLIDFDEFCLMMKKSLRHRSLSDDGQQPATATLTGNAVKDEFRPLFAAFDKDNSGYIDAGELKATMSAVGLQLTDKDVDMMIHAAGVAKGGRIFYEDFVKMLVSSGLCSESSAGDSVGSVIPQSPNASYCSLAVDGVSNEQELQELCVAFSTFDKDGDGQITVNEVEQIIKSLGVEIEREDIRMMVDLVDTDGNGSISFDEFCQLMRVQKHSASSSSQTGDALLRDTFQIFDKDDDGLLSASDLRDTMQQLGLCLSEADVKAMMKSVGVGPQGKISYSDFCKILSFNEQSNNEAAAAEKNCSRATVRKRRDELQAVFRLFDKDGDGFITMKEVTDMLTSMGIKPSQSRIKEIFHQVDLDGNNEIDFEEFVLLVNNYEKPMSRDREIREMFNAIDKDRSGFIDAEELKLTFTTLGVELNDGDIKTMLKDVGIKGDRIFFEDFVKIIMANLGSDQQNNLQNVDRSVDVVDAQTTCATASRQNRSEELHIQFAQFDKNGDGRITESEMCDVMTSLGFECQPQEVRRILHRGDANNDGTIDFDEFCTVMSRYRPRSVGTDNSSATPVDTKQVFKVFDKNSDGWIDEDELQQTMKELGVTLSTKDVNAMFSQVGCKNTRRITYAEFATLVMNAAPGQSLADVISSQSDISSRSNSRVMDDTPSSDDIRVSEANVCNSVAPQKQELTRSAPIEISTIRNLIMSDQQQPSLPASTDSGSKLSNSPPDTWKAFRVFDRNSDGYVSKSELYHTLKELGVNLSLEELNSKMKEADTNQDGCIDYAEFRQLMKGAFELYAKQAVRLHRQKSLNESTVQQNVVDRSKVRQNMKASFDSADTNHDGRIDADQLSQIATELKSKQHAKALIVKYGSRGDGTINFNEFERIKSHCEVGRERQLSDKSRDAEQSLRTAFKVFDIDNNGFIDSTELRDTLAQFGGSESVSKEHCDALLRAVDKNGDGQIDYEEFIWMMYP